MPAKQPTFQTVKLVLTCEHGGCLIPRIYRPLFQGSEEVLNSHRGWDPGALELFKKLVPLADFHKSSSTSRLLIELNRSIDHPRLFSEFTKTASPEQKKRWIDTYYQPYRREVEACISEMMEQGAEVLHVSVHTFTPVLHGVVREADMGLLFDPTRVGEKKICKFIRHQLYRKLPSFKVRFNYPYLGKADGFTTSLRKKFPMNYYGVELEVNQKFYQHGRVEQEVKTALYETLQASLRGTD